MATTGSDGRGTVYKPNNDGFMVLHVHAPELRKQSLGPDYHEYPITGCDSNGDIECARRFNLFYEFRQALVWKYNGLYIPPLPPKKVTGKAEELTLLERKHFLDLFLKECTQLKYICQSLELQTFLKP
jgi:sorting nexin-1/2